jgi:hypothetical protein
MTRARVRLRYTDPLNPVPDIRENIVFLPPAAREREAIAERGVRTVATAKD